MWFGCLLRLRRRVWVVCFGVQGQHLEEDGAAVEYEQRQAMDYTADAGAPEHNERMVQAEVCQSERGAVVLAICGSYDGRGRSDGAS